MDPLSAISLACNILSFVEATKGLVSSTRQLLQRGEQDEFVELELLTRDLQAWVVRITPPTASYRHRSSLSPEEKTICSLGSQCSQVAADLLGVLETLKVARRDGARHHIESFYKALVAAWKQEEVDKLRRRLDRISTSIQRELAIYDQRRILRRLDELEVSGYRSQLQTLRQDLNRGFEAISGELQKQESRGSALELLLRTAAQGSQYSAEQYILERLRFDEINHRRLNIRVAHNQTLSWLFGDETQRSPATLDEWLVSDDDLYWISGKPGSGKSTLMCPNRNRCVTVFTRQESSKPGPSRTASSMPNTFSGPQEDMGC